MEVPKPFPKYDKVEDQKNVRLAARLDYNRCQWHLFKENVVRQGSAPHHIYGRRRRWDLDAIITLCMSCHTDFHTARQVKKETIITKEKLIALMEEKVIPIRKLRAKQLGVEIPENTGI